MHEHSGIVDLRSDTVTRPTTAMYERMMTAPIGDDGLDGDPTARALEEKGAEALGKEAALFTPSCTMANLLATLAQLGRCEQVVLEAEAHMYMTERGGATIAGAFYLPIIGNRGAMDLDLLEDAISPGRSRLKTGMIAMETSHNNAGGTVLTLDHMAAVASLAARHGIPVHLDGARMFNAAVYLGVEPSAIASHCDTVSLCLSKGLSAPVGAIVAGPRPIVDRMRSLRKMLGGQQRQVGIVAAAGLEAIAAMGPRLAEDHLRARALSVALNQLGLSIAAAEPQTNIVLVDVSNTSRSAGQWVSDLAGFGVLVRPWTKNRVRCVTHRHIQDDDIARTAAAFGMVEKAVSHHERTA